MVSDRDRKTLARLRRAEKIEALRDGRFNRSAKFSSPKDYKRKGKHTNNGGIEDEGY